MTKLLQHSDICSTLKLLFLLTFTPLILAAESTAFMTTDRSKLITVPFRMGLRIRMGIFNRILIETPTRGLFYTDKIVFTPMTEHVKEHVRCTRVADHQTPIRKVAPAANGVITPYACLIVKRGIIYEFVSAVKSVSGSRLCKAMCGVFMENCRGERHVSWTMGKMKGMFDGFDRLEKGDRFVILVTESVSTGTFDGGDVLLIQSSDKIKSGRSVQYTRKRIRNGMTMRPSNITGVYGRDCPTCSGTFIRAMESFMK